MWTHHGRNNEELQVEKKIYNKDLHDMCGN